MPQSVGVPEFPDTDSKEKESADYWTVQLHDWAQLYNSGSFHQIVKAQCARYRLNHQVDDIEQQVALKIIRMFEHKSELPIKSFVGYVSAITRNVLVDLWREERKGEPLASSLDDLPVESHPSFDPTQIYIDSILCEELIRSLDSEELQFLKFFLEGASLREIAKMYGITSSGASRKLSRLIWKLKGNL